MTRKTYFRRFGALFVPAFLGVVVLVATTAEQLGRQLEALPEVPEIPLPVLLALAVVQPAILVAIAVALGLAFAPRLGLRSHWVSKAAGEPLVAGFRPEVAAAFGWGVITALLLLALDTISLSLLGDAGEQLSLMSNRTAAVTLAGVVYGGITEEVLIRWGLVPLLAVGVQKFLRQPGKGSPDGPVMWPAIVLSALIFGAGHLPALSQATDLTGAIVARTLVLNGAAGVVFGWLFWRRSLEAAMLAHATVHIVWTLVAQGSRVF
jgi:membrane protease YdiL (CAAX protease family)